MPLVFLPERNELFHWGDEPPPAVLAALSARAGPAQAELLVPRGSRAAGVVTRAVPGIRLPLLEAVADLSAVPSAEVERLSASVAVWTLASKLALDLVSRERVVPGLVRQDGGIRARWSVGLSAPGDAAQVARLACAMPAAAHAVPAPAGGAGEVWAPEALLREFLDVTADALLRASRSGAGTSQAGGANGRRRSGRRPGRNGGVARDPAPWERRWEAALLSTQDGAFETAGFGERTLIDDLRAWSEPALGARDRLRACFRLELPASDRQPFVLRFLLQSPDDPSLLVTAEEVWSAKRRSLQKLGRAFRDPQEALLSALGRAARLFAPIEEGLSGARPEALALDAAAAWEFLERGAQALAGAGFGVIVPAELTRAGQRRLRLRMRVGGRTAVAGAVSGAAGLGMTELLSFQWEAAIGDEALTLRQLQALARQKAPLVRYRGQWVAVDPGELEEVRRRVAAEGGRIPVARALLGALAGETQDDEGGSVAVAAQGAFGELVARLRGNGRQPAGPPVGFVGKLRPYQARGLAWLQTLGALGLGACLADDMGLGKTIQLLAFLLHRLEQNPGDPRPALLVAPTSVLGNWEREAGRFAPALRVVHHYGAGRARTRRDVARGAGTVVLTSYGLLRRDAALLSSVEWSAVVLDEAQNIKNAASATARAARSLRAAHRFALTGTPVENRLAELWSIFEFMNPGLLGPLETFRRELAVPIERYGNDEAAARLRKVVAPFLLRRVKSDPAIIRDLPPKNEMKVVCTLTREQATLYQAVVDEEMRRIESADGMERRGRVLALLMFLKQICNHPSQYLCDAGPLARRSGKLERTAEMLEEAIADGDRALVFTQFREMGDRLASHLGERLGEEVAFLHGGTRRRARDEMVRRFQDEARGPRIFVLSVKAGGTGLNLTRANHVFHFDRWWNPAVEDQATDRAYRIGQKRTVYVHKLVCAGTVEEKVDRMLEQKRALASKVVGSGESWITELDNASLRELFALAPGADAVAGEDDEDLAGGRIGGRG